MPNPTRSRATVVQTVPNPRGSGARPPRPRRPPPAAGTVARAGGFAAIATSEREPMRAADRIRVLAGIGLEGDRYATGRGHFSSTPGTGPFSHLQSSQRAPR